MSYDVPFYDPTFPAPKSSFCITPREEVCSLGGAGVWQEKCPRQEQTETKEDQMEPAGLIAY